MELCVVSLRKRLADIFKARYQLGDDPSILVVKMSWSTIPQTGKAQQWNRASKQLLRRGNWNRG